MRYLELINWPHVSGLTLGDSPVSKKNGVDVYELISQYEQIEVKSSGRYLGTYKNVALINREAHVFDLTENRSVKNLGPYRIYKVGHDWSLHPVA